MNCPFCETKNTKVLDSRLLKQGASVRRRRECIDCERRFTTYESFEVNMPMVIKVDGRREKYETEKILTGIKKACEKRPISTTQVERVIDNIEKKILEISEKEISSREIGSMVMKYLHMLDPVAYVRFASVYRKFQDIEEFVTELKHDEENFISNLKN